MDFSFVCVACFFDVCAYIYFFQRKGRNKRNKEQQEREVSKKRIKKIKKIKSSPNWKRKDSKETPKKEKFTLLSKTIIIYLPSLRKHLSQQQLWL